MELLLRSELGTSVAILTPTDPSARGCQLSLSFHPLPVKEIQRRLGEEGIIVDTREPYVMRVAPAPLYNTAQDVCEFVSVLRDVLHEVGRAKLG